MKDKNKDFFSGREAEKIHHQQTHTKEKSKSFKRKENDMKEKPGSTKGIKSTEKCNYTNKHKIIFLII